MPNRNNDDDIDKLLATYTFRMPQFTKNRVHGLSSYWKNKLNQELLLTTAKVLYDSEFDPSRYLKE